MQDVAELFRGEMDPSSVYTVEEKEYESVWGKQHIDVLTNFAAHINHGTPLIADGAEGINGVRLASGMQLSAWTGREIDLVDYPAEEYLAEPNKRIEAEGEFPTRSCAASAGPPPHRRRPIVGAGARPTAHTPARHPRRRTTMPVLGLQLMMLKDQINEKGMYEVLRQVRDLDID